MKEVNGSSSEAVASDIGLQLGLLTPKQQEGVLGVLISKVLNGSASPPETDGEQPFEPTFNLDRSDYELTVAAIGSVRPEEPELLIPAFETVDLGLSEKSRIFLAAQALRGDSPELTFDIPMGCSKFTDFITRYNVPFRARRLQILVEHPEIMNAYAHHDFGKRTHSFSAFLLNDKTDPLDRSQPSNDHGEPGLVYTGGSVAEQGNLFELERNRGLAKNVPLNYVSMSQYFLVQVKRMLSGEDPLDSKGTVTGFNQFPDHALDGKLHIPSAHASNISSVGALPNGVKGRIYSIVAGSSRLTGDKNRGMRRSLVID